MASGRMRLFAFDFQGPAHLSAGLWRHEHDQGARYNDLRYWTDYAKLLEQGRFDGIFFADNVGYHDDGYNLGHAVKYQDIADFIELVVPELQRRGTMWTHYDGSTLREKLYGPGAIRLRDDHPGHRIAHPTADATH